MKFKHGDKAMELTISTSRDEENKLIVVDSFFSTGNPMETRTMLDYFWNVARRYELVNMGYDNYDVKARNFLKEKYGKTWWHKIFKNMESIEKATEQVNKIWEEMRKKKIKTKIRKIKDVRPKKVKGG